MEQVGPSRVVCEDEAHRRNGSARALREQGVDDNVTIRRNQASNPLLSSGNRAGGGAPGLRPSQHPLAVEAPLIADAKCR
jgi:hypothetical protein